MMDMFGGMMGGAGGAGGMGGGMGDMFAEMLNPANLQRMKTLPKFASYFADPAFAAKYEMCCANPNMLMQ
jgi:hypothetical protein